MMKRTNMMLVLLTFLFIFLLIGSSCRTDEHTAANVDNGSIVNNENDINNQVESTVDESIAEAKPDIPEDLKFEGKTFTFIMNSAWGTSGWTQISDIYSEEEIGDPINDAIYRRNAKVEERFGIKIVEIMVDGTEQSSGQGEAFKMIKKTADANDNTYDAAIIAGYEASTLAYNGYLKNQFDMPYMDMHNVWWDQGAIRDFNINNYLYMSTGDISWMINGATYAIMFNKQLVQNYQIPNLYEIVNKGEWTIDKWGEISKTVAADLNGDGVWDGNDRYGSLIWDDAIMGMINAANERCGTINSQGEIELTLNTQRVLSTVEQYLDIACEKNVSYAFQRTGSADVRDMFGSERGLFYLRILREIPALRNMETDFGILPYPKLNAEQEQYVSGIASYPSVYLVIPGTADSEMSGAVLEEMSYWSREYLRPAYFDVTLKGKGTRDEESVEMLDIILSNRVFDLGWLYQIGTYNEQLMNLFRNYTKDFVSMYERNETNANTKLSEINAAYQSIIK